MVKVKSRDRSTEDIIAKMLQKIKTAYEPEKVILFGSYAYGKPTKDSDVDLLIIKNTKKSQIDRRVQVRKLVKEENRILPFSPLVYTPKELKHRLEIGDDFVQEVLQKGKVLYEKQ
jgi:predicted nucleotidyltransferase